MVYVHACSLFVVTFSYAACYNCIVSPPKFINGLQSWNIDLKQNATLTCDVCGYNVSYEWKIESGSFPRKVTGTNSATLVIPDVRSSDSNTYICEVSNLGGNVSSNYTLTVTGMAMIMYHRVSHIS